MRIQIIYLIALAVAIGSCNSSGNKSGDEHATEGKNKSEKQINISVLWDLSDRINPALRKEVPSNADRDVAIIKYLAAFLKGDMDHKGAFSAKGRLKVFFSPNPSSPDINSLASKLDVDLSGKDVKDKKVIYDNITGNFEDIAKQICDITIKTSKWEGSDIYRFFKNDVVDYCVSKDSSYRNVLVILTDGYIYHSQTKGRLGNKSEYILPELLSSLGLRNSQDLKSTFIQKKCGLIPARFDLKGLEVLVLEVNSEPNHKNDEDIIKMYLEDWFSQMNVGRMAIYNTDLPENTQKRIGNFLSSK